MVTANLKMTPSCHFVKFCRSFPESDLGVYCIVFVSFLFGHEALYLAGKETYFSPRVAGHS